MPPRANIEPMSMVDGKLKIMGHDLDRLTTHDRFNWSAAQHQVFDDTLDFAKNPNWQSWLTAKLQDTSRISEADFQSFFDEEYLSSNLYPQLGFQRLGTHEYVHKWGTVNPKIISQIWKRYRESRDAQGLGTMTEAGQHVESPQSSPMPAFGRDLANRSLDDMSIPGSFASLESSSHRSLEEGMNLDYELPLNDANDVHDDMRPSTVDDDALHELKNKVARARNVYNETQQRQEYEQQQAEAREKERSLLQQELETIEQQTRGLNLNSSLLHSRGRHDEQLPMSSPVALHNLRAHSQRQNEPLLISSTPATVSQPHAPPRSERCGEPSLTSSTFATASQPYAPPHSERRGEPLLTSSMVSSPYPAYPSFVSAERYGHQAAPTPYDSRAFRSMDTLRYTPSTSTRQASVHLGQGSRTLDALSQEDLDQKSTEELKQEHDEELRRLKELKVKQEQLLKKKYEK